MYRMKQTKEDHKWADAVKVRDNHCCVICGSNIRPNAHHIIVRENHETKLEIDNGLTLCPKHHLFCRKISAHNNPLGLFVWLEENRPDQLAFVREKMKVILKNED
jgi:predicted restriction endonuclease